MISPDSMTRKSCGERFDLIASDFVVLAENLLVEFVDFGLAKIAGRPTAMLIAGGYSQSFKLLEVSAYYRRRKI